MGIDIKDDNKDERIKLYQNTNKNKDNTLCFFMKIS